MWFHEGFGLIHNAFVTNVTTNALETQVNCKEVLQFNRIRFYIKSPLSSHRV